MNWKRAILFIFIGIVLMAVAVAAYDRWAGAAYEEEIRGLKDEITRLKDEGEELLRRREEAEERWRQKERELQEVRERAEAQRAELDRRIAENNLLIRRLEGERIKLVTDLTNTLAEIRKEMPSQIAERVQNQMNVHYSADFPGSFFRLTGVDDIFATNDPGARSIAQAMEEAVSGKEQMANLDQTIRQKDANIDALNQKVVTFEDELGATNASLVECRNVNDAQKAECANLRATLQKTEELARAHEGQIKRLNRRVWWRTFIAPIAAGAAAYAGYKIGKQ